MQEIKDQVKVLDGENIELRTKVKQMEDMLDMREK